jgi:RimJ/RimL family protein N-acetyltransferase
VAAASPRTVFAIGSTGLELGQDVHRRTAELGYWLAEPFAVNPASARVLEKAGFSLEGRMRASVFKDGRVLDQLLYSVVNV